MGTSEEEEEELMLSDEYDEPEEKNADKIQYVVTDADEGDWLERQAEAERKGEEVEEVVEES